MSGHVPGNHATRKRWAHPFLADDYVVWRIGYDDRFYPLGDIPAFMEWPVPCEADFAQPFAENYDEWTVWQQGRCAICGDESRGRSLHRDHDHETGLIRGYLCGWCNREEGCSSAPVFRFWRAGMNPCAMFGWDYLWQGQHYQKALEPHEVRELTRLALVRRLEMPQQMREAMEKLGALLSGGLNNTS